MHSHPLTTHIKPRTKACLLALSWTQTKSRLGQARHLIEGSLQSAPKKSLSAFIVMFMLTLNASDRSATQMPLDPDRVRDLSERAQTLSKRFDAMLERSKADADDDDDDDDDDDELTEPAEEALRNTRL
jgi:hypothetical protein